MTSIKQPDQIIHVTHSGVCHFSPVGKVEEEFMDVSTPSSSIIQKMVRHLVWIYSDQSQEALTHAYRSQELVHCSAPCPLVNRMEDREAATRLLENWHNVETSEDETD